MSLRAVPKRFLTNTRRVASSGAYLSITQKASPQPTPSLTSTGKVSETSPLGYIRFYSECMSRFPEKLSKMYISEISKTILREYRKLKPLDTQALEEGNRRGIQRIFRRMQRRRNGFLTFLQYHREVSAMEGLPPHDLKSMSWKWHGIRDSQKEKYSVEPEDSIKMYKSLHATRLDIIHQEKYQESAWKKRRRLLGKMRVTKACFDLYVRLRLKRTGVRDAKYTKRMIKGIREYTPALEIPLKRILKSIHKSLPRAYLSQSFGTFSGNTEKKEHIKEFFITESYHHAKQFGKEIGFTDRFRKAVQRYDALDGRAVDQVGRLEKRVKKLVRQVLKMARSAKDGK